MTLFDIEKTIQNVLENCIDPETGEVVDEELLVQYDSLRMAKEEKAENICCFIKNLEAEANATAEEANKMAARAKSAKSKAAHLRNYLQFCLNGEKLSTPRAAVTYRRSQQVKAEPEAWRFLPEKYLHIKQPEVNKVEVGKALKAGEMVPGCKLVDNVSMIIK